MSEKPMLLVVATYPSLPEAEADYQALLAAHKVGEIGHLAAAIVTRDGKGDLSIVRHDTTTKHLAWGGAALGSALVLLVSPLGVPYFAVLTGAAITGGELAGIGAIVGHFWRGIPKKDLRELGDTLEGAEAGIVAVGVDKQEAEIEKALDRAERKVVKRVEKGDLAGAYDAALTGAAKAEEIAEG
jgi:uncharacterized membrane protein